MVESHVLLVVGVNCFLAGLVLWSAVALWRWRYDLMQLTVWLQSLEAARSVAAASQRIGLALTIRRSQLIESRLGLTRLQLLIRQLAQLLGLVRWLIVVSRWRRRSRGSAGFRSTLEAKNRSNHTRGRQ